MLACFCWRYWNGPAEKFAVTSRCAVSMAMVASGCAIMMTMWSSLPWFPKFFLARHLQYNRQHRHPYCRDGDAVLPAGTRRHLCVAVPNPALCATLGRYRREAIPFVSDFFVPFDLDVGEARSLSMLLDQLHFLHEHELDVAEAVLLCGMQGGRLRGSWPSAPDRDEREGHH